LIHLHLSSGFVFLFCFADASAGAGAGAVEIFDGILEMGTKVWIASAWGSSYHSAPQPIRDVTTFVCVCKPVAGAPVFTPKVSSILCPFGITRCISSEHGVVCVVFG
jgi:hypothetical protein